MTARVLKAPEVAVVAVEPQRPGFRAALEQAFAQGRAQGHEEATAGLEREIRALCQALTDTVESARAELAVSSRLDAELVTTLAADLAAWFLDGAVEVDAAAVLDGMRRVLGDSVNVPGAVLHVAPQVAEALGDVAAPGLDVIRPDPALGPADFVLVADTTVTERRWREALDDIRPDVVAALRASGRS